jgi:isopentenyl-diphosphate Delta-isomerase
MNCNAQFAFSFTYHAKFSNGLTEHEFDHVYIGFSDQLPKPNAAEVQDWQYLSLENLSADIQLHPEKYTEWMKICLPQVQAYVHTHFQHELAK